MKLNLIEEQRFTSDGVIEHSRTDLPGGKVILAFPFKINIGAATIVFYTLPVIRHEKLLPAYIQSIDEVAHIHELLFRHLTNQRRIQFPVGPAAINNGGSASLLCRLDTIEKNLHRPAMHMGALIMKQN